MAIEKKCCHEYGSPVICKVLMLCLYEKIIGSYTNSVFSVLRNIYPVFSKELVNLYSPFPEDIFFLPIAQLQSNQRKTLNTSRELINNFKISRSWRIRKKPKAWLQNSYNWKEVKIKGNTASRKRYQTWHETTWGNMNRKRNGWNLNKVYTNFLILMIVLWLYQMLTRKLRWGYMEILLLQLFCKSGKILNKIL